MVRPTYLSSFVGREVELNEIRSRLREKSTRLLTLVGPGGAGKTRLAHEAINGLADAYEDGIAWIDLVGLSLPSAVPQTVASALEINITGGQSAIEALSGTLCSREILIVMDNCEHVAAACADLLDALLRECAELSILTTSRIPLGLEGEHIWSVPPMSHPESLSAQQSLAGFDAVKLFAERARQVRPDFKLEDQVPEVLVKIIKLLDGQPLAIELAAARLNALNLHQMASRLEDQLSFLSDRSEIADPRHRSMEAAIRWSYELLSDDEAILFRRLGVFIGGFSLQAAEAICALPPVDPSEVLELIEMLIRNSLLARVESGAGHTRYRMLEAVRQFAHSRLIEARELGPVRNRHLEYFAAMTTDAEAHMLGPQQPEWTQRLEQDYPNIHSALNWAFAQAEDTQDDQLPAAQFAASLFWPWNYMERYEEAASWCERALGLSALEQSSRLYADLTRFLGTFVWLSGDFALAKTKLEISMQVSEEIEYEYCAANARLLLGIIELHEKQVEHAIEKLLESETTFIELNEARELSIAQTNLGSAFMELGDLERARDYAERAVAGARASQDSWAQGLSLQILGSVIHRQGDAESALPLMQEALELLELVGQGWLQAETLWREAVILREIGELERAVQQLERCFELSEEIGAREWQLSALQSLGFIAVQQDNVQHAIGYFTQVFRLTGGQAYRHIQVRVLLGVIELALLGDQPEWAVRLWKMYRSLCRTYALPASRDETRVHDSLLSSVGGATLNVDEEKEISISLEEAAGVAEEYLYRMELHAPQRESPYDLRLQGLGPTDVFLEGRQLVASDWTFAKPKELLFYLASSTPKTKQEIGLVFWPDASPDQLRAGLRAALYHLRKALGKREWILYEDGYYCFNHDMNYVYDLERFEQHVERGRELARSTPGEAIDLLEEAVSLYRGDFVADLADDDWASIKREELRRTYQESAILLSELLIDEGKFQRSEQFLRLVLQEDPLFEEAHRGLMRCYAGRGEHGLVTRQYENAVRIMQAELGVAPSVETTDLYQSLVQRENQPR